MAHHKPQLPAKTHPEQFLRGCSNLDLSQLEMLVVNGFYGHFHYTWGAEERKQAWLTALRPMQALRRLRFVGLDSNALITFAYALRVRADVGTGPAVCPMLAVLELYDVEDEFKSLYDMILQRAQNGGLEEVKIRNVQGWDQGVAVRLMNEVGRKIVIEVETSDAVE